ncbi:MAG: hypothetical protein JKY42_04320, partial [Flavobacteriales bacterium]|nr:hypothetical protein [Flavobacteriales bacterium]
MKKISLLFITFLTGATIFAQSYNVTLCGSVTNSNGISATLLIDYWGPSNQGSVTAVTDSAGNWCVNFTAFTDSGTTTSLIDYVLISQMNCATGFAGDTLPNLLLTQDTSFFSTFDYCGGGSPANCSVLVYDSLGVDLYAVPVGQAPYVYSWSDGSTGSFITNLLPNTLYTVVVVDANGCSSTASYQTTGGGTG